MPSFQYPILTWQDLSGATTAVLLGNVETATAHAGTRDEALRQLRELLEWRFEHEPWNVDPDFNEPSLSDVKVEVRPQYPSTSSGGTSGQARLLPCPETVWLRVPCVTGRQENGMHLCVVPHLGLSFSFQDIGSLKNLVAHYVKEALQGLSPVEVAGRLPPRECRLDHTVLRDSSQRIRRVAPADRPELKILFTVADPLLQDLGRKRTASAAYGRDALAGILVRKLGIEKANVLLVGEAGVGKSTLLLDAVKKLLRTSPAAPQDDPDAAELERGLAAFRFWRGNGGRLIAGMRYLGEWEERCEKFIQQLSAIDGVFCAENLLELVRVGGEGPGNSVAAFLLPYLQRAEMRMVSEATPAELEACRRLLPGVLDVFQVVPVPVFEEAAALEVLKRIAFAHGTSAKIEFDPGLIPTIHRLFKRFRPYTAFPGAASHFVRSLCERATDSRRVPQSAGPKSISTRDVVDLFLKQTGLPEIFLRNDLPLSFEEVQRHFDSRIIGQPQATHAVARLVTTLKAGLHDPARPLGVSLFCGPTGVGKTALALELAAYCFGATGQKDRLVRLDMSEYSAWGAAQRFLLDPHGGPAPWIERVRQQPFCVVLFDEIEKAAPEVFDVLLGLLDEGRLTDRFGKVTWFRSAFLILTSNLGTATATAGFAGTWESTHESEVARFFRPEFFNRLDEIVTFVPLGPTDVLMITRKELAELASREGLAASGIQLEWAESLVAVVAREGYDHRFGARPLQRAIERLIVTPLARWKVANPTARDLTLHVDLGETGQIQFQPQSS